MYLLDTNVLSELRRARPHGAVLAWFRSVPEASIYVPAVVLGEAQIGIEATRVHDPAKAAELELWLDRVAARPNVLAMTGAAFRLWAKLMRGRSQVLSTDAMIAATARVHNFTVVTRNSRDFEAFDVALLNPFDSAADPS